MKLKNIIIPVLFLVVISATSVLLAMNKSGFFSADTEMGSTTAPLTDKPILGPGKAAKVVVPNPGGSGPPIEIIIRHDNNQNDVPTAGTFVDALAGIFWTITKIALIFIAIYFVFKLLKERGLLGRTTPKGGGSPANHTADKEVGRWINPEDITGNGFADVAGVPEAVRQLQLVAMKISEQAEKAKEIRSESIRSGTGQNNVLTTNEQMGRLQSMLKKSKFGGVVPQGVLLVGPPGTGKTLLVRALAKECNVPIFSISGSAFDEVWVGLGAERMRKMFSDARFRRPCIIFIDELDAVGKKRSSGPSSNAESAQTLNQFLAEMQGLNAGGNDNIGLWIIGATNRVDILDEALLRPGRFTWHIKVDPPNFDGRVAILKLHSNNRQMPLETNVDFRAIASVLPGLSGAALEDVVNETALYAEELSKQQAKILRTESGATDEEIEAKVKAAVSQEDFFEGLLRHLMGRKLEASLSFDQTFNTVVHEAGHALANAYEQYLGRTNEMVRFISIEPRDKALGLTFKTPGQDSFGKTLEQVDSDVVCAYGGSAAQRVFLNTKDTGPDNDNEVAAGNIYRAIGRWYGSEKLGPISLGQRGMSNGTEMGPALKNAIDSECILKTKVLYARSWWILNLFIRSESVWTMFWELLEHKIMRQERFAELFATAIQEVETHPEWRNGDLDELLARVKNDPYSWSADPLNEETRAYLSARVDQLRSRYAAL